MNRRTIDPGLADVTTWPGFTTDGLDAATARLVTNRITAMRLYLEGRPHREIASETSIGRREVARLWKRCVAVHLDGRIFGFRACGYYSHTVPYSRSAAPKAVNHITRAGFVGLLGKLFARYPKIPEALLGKAQDCGRGANEPLLRFGSLHREFLKLARECGVAGDDYPFNCLSQGERSLAQWLRRELQRRNLRRYVNVSFGQDAADRVGFSDEPVRVGSQLLPFERCEFDGHRIDVIMVIEISDPTSGEPTLLTVERIWLLTVIDVASRAILGYHISLERNYTAEDVLICLENCIVPARKRDLTCPGLSFPEGAGFPSEIVPELAYALWGTLALDNAKSNCASWVWERVRDCIGCTINPGPIKSPESRRFIERFFGTLERSGFQRLPSTTGSNPSDGKRRDPEDAAISLNIRIDEIHDMVEVLLATYNVTPTQALHGRSPLDYLRFALGRKSFLPRYVPEKDRATFTLTLLKATAVVRGRLRAGERPYVQYLGVKYYSAELSASAQLLGQRVLIEANSRDLRRIRMFLESGEEFGVLTATQKWAGTVHDLRSRKAILKKTRMGKDARRAMPDAVAEYLSLKSDEAKTRKRSRNELAHVQRLQHLAEKASAATSEISGEPKSALVRQKAPAVELPVRAMNF